MMKACYQIRNWRRAKRTELLERRRALTREQRSLARSVIVERILDQVPEIGSGIVGFYVPIQGELDMRDFVSGCLLKGARAALPVVVEKHQPVQFRAWTPETKMVRGFWDIPVPDGTERVAPTLLLIPLVGFDAAGYRLGYGGGYYDRTLASMTPKPIAIGIGLECCRLASIHPQPHDIPMDAVVTEKEFRWREEPAIRVRAARTLHRDADRHTIG